LLSPTPASLAAINLVAISLTQVQQTQLRLVCGWNVHLLGLVKKLQQMIRLTLPEKVDIPEEWITKENVQMTQKPRRIFTDEQRAEAVRIVHQSGKPVIQVAREMGLTESALRRWVEQAHIEQELGSAREVDFC
jgi:Transposase